MENTKENIKKILLVEDEPILGITLKQRLEREGLEVIYAKDGDEALNILKSNTKPDLMLLDIILPKLSGFELMEIIRNDINLSQIPIFVISNLGQDNDINRGKKLGAIDYFIKAHTSIEDLVNTIKNFLTK
ncbi:MAG: response regulator [Minisyncoccia bacterium]